MSQTFWFLIDKLWERELLMNLKSIFIKNENIKKNHNNLEFKMNYKKFILRNYKEWFRI